MHNSSRGHYVNKFSSQRTKQRSRHYQEHQVEPSRNISEAETSQDQQCNSRDIKNERQRYIQRGRQRSNANSFKSSDVGSYGISSRRKSNHGQQRGLRSQFHQNSKKKILSQKKQASNQQQSTNSQDKSQIQLNKKNEEAIEEAKEIQIDIQQLNFKSLEFNQLFEQFLKCCQGHVQFEEGFPQQKDQIGRELIKNGFFHDLWSKVYLKNSQIKKKQVWLQQYYNRFVMKIEKCLTNFEKVFNSISSSESDENDSQTVFKAYRQKSLSQNTNSTVKIDCMIVFHQIKNQLQSEEFQTLDKKISHQINKWIFKTAEDQLCSNLQCEKIDQYNQDNQFQQYKDWDKNQQQQKNKDKVKKIVQLRQRQYSPHSKRFRMMHDSQNNERRCQVEIACVVLGINSYYYLNDLEITKIQELIFSEKQQIIVVKAYIAEYIAQMGVVKIQPKIKNLIGAYKFSSIIELIRLEQTHGKFDGIIVYPESFDLKKYLDNSKQLNLIKEDYLRQIRSQVPESI